MRPSCAPPSAPRKPGAPFSSTKISPQPSPSGSAFVRPMPTSSTQQHCILFGSIFPASASLPSQASAPRSTARPSPQFSTTIPKPPLPPAGMSMPPPASSSTPCAPAKEAPTSAKSPQSWPPKVADTPAPLDSTPPSRFPSLNTSPLHPHPRPHAYSAAYPRSPH